MAWVVCAFRGLRASGPTNRPPNRPTDQPTDRLIWGPKPGRTRHEFLEQLDWANMVDVGEIINHRQRDMLEEISE